jgi:hypothetical protein
LKVREKIWFTLLMLSSLISCSRHLNIKIFLSLTSNYLLIWHFNSTFHVSLSLSHSLSIINNNKYWFSLLYIQFSLSRERAKENSFSKSEKKFLFFSQRCRKWKKTLNCFSLFCFAFSVVICRPVIASHHHRVTTWTNE